MTEPPDGKVVIVTGASRVIGAALAGGLAAAGACVAVNYEHDGAGARRVVRALLDGGGSATAIRADIGSRAGVEALVAGSPAAYGKPAGLVNNAARTRLGPLDEVDDEDFDDVVGTVLRGPLLGSIAAARAMLAAGGGSIVDISSVSVDAIMPCHGPYTAANGLENLTRRLALELAPGVRVDAIAPSATVTERGDHGAPTSTQRLM
jgi:3-oxoacyl-[acyl-carrier protein] reductase